MQEGEKMAGSENIMMIKLSMALLIFNSYSICVFIRPEPAKSVNDKMGVTLKKVYKRRYWAKNNAKKLRFFLFCLGW